MLYTASIIILNYNAYKLTIQCIKKIFQTTYGISYEIIIVDNGSTDKSVAVIRNLQFDTTNSKIRLLISKKNLGFSVANNLAAKKSKGKYLVFVNNDVVFTSNWIKDQTDFLKRNKTVACTQPKIRSFVHKNYFDYTGGCGGFIDILGYPFTRGRVFDSVEKDLGQYDYTTKVTWVSGACFVCKKNLFLKVNGFDENFFAYQEEIDLCLRLKRQGYSAYCLPQSLVYHYGSYTSNKDLSKKTFLNHLNSLYVFVKNYSFWPFFPLFIIRVLFDLFSIVYYISQKRFSFVISVFKAYGVFFLSLSRLHLSILKYKSLNMETVYKGFIVFDYFVLGRRDFESITQGKQKNKRNLKTYSEVTYFKK